MTNVSGTPAKRATRRGLFAFGIEALEKQGWTVSRIARGGKASLRRITKGSVSHKISIRTSQDTWIAFPRKSTGQGWVTLDDVDFVLAVSVDDRHNPTKASAHLIPGAEARTRFDRAYAARQRAGHTLPIGRGIWLSLYDEEASEPVSHVGAGMGLAFPAIETRDITRLGDTAPLGDDDPEDVAEEGDVEGDVDEALQPLSIPEAKRRLAATLGVPESAIKISIEH